MLNNVFMKLTTIVLLISLTYLIINGIQEGKYPYWNRYKTETFKKYDFVENIETNRVGPSLAIWYELDHEVGYAEIEPVFKDLMSQSPEALDDLWKKHDGFRDIWVGFEYEGNTSANYIFSPVEIIESAEGFEKYIRWNVEHKGEEEKIIIVK